MFRAGLLVGAVPALLVTGPAMSGAAAGKPHGSHPARGGLAWRPCNEPAYPALQCATMKVPLDYAAPRGRTVTLALSRVPAQGGAKKGALVVNPGGPGASGLVMAGDIAARLPKNISRDVIGFDPRGVGNSQPALQCDPDYFDPVRPGYVPSSERLERRWLHRVRGYAAACEKRYGWLLPHMTTANVARDMDRIRGVLGQPKISFLGYSYGTYLGAMYGHLFPGRVHRMVLDSVVAPSRVWYSANLGQNRAFEARFQDFFRWIARNNATYRLGSTPGAVQDRWYEMRAELRRHPAGGRVGSSELDDTFMAAGYDSETWPVLGAAFADQVTAGKPQGLSVAFDNLGRVGTEGENGYAVYAAVGCRDAPWPRDWARWRADASRAYASARFVTWNNTWYNAPCAFWGVPAERPVRIDGRRLPPMLLIQAERDAATPQDGAAEMRRTVPSARLVLERNGGDHGVSMTGNRCVDQHVFRYLNNGRLPRAGGGAAGTSGGPGGTQGAGSAAAVADAACATSPDPPAFQRGRAMARPVSRCLGRLPYAGVVPQGNC